MGNEPEHASMRKGITMSEETSPSEKGSPTSADVARRAGVSRTTVSYILNEVPGQKFPDKTRQAVFRAAEELGYSPNVMAKSLAGGNGLILLTFTQGSLNELTTTIANNVTTALARKGIMVAVHFQAEQPTTLLEIIRALRPRAVVFSAPPDPMISRLLTDLEIAAIMTGVADYPLDAETIGSCQARYLLARGHRRLAYAEAAGPATWLALQRRHDIRLACAAARLSEPLTAAFSPDGHEAPAIIQAWREQQITGICAYDDDVALAVLFGIRKAGLLCPDDMAVIGADGISAGAVAYPPLTTIAINAHPAAEWYAQALLHQLHLGPFPPSVPQNMLTLIERASC